MVLDLKKNMHAKSRPQYMKISAAARYLGLSPNTVRRYTDLALIQAKRLPGGDRLYAREWLDAFVEQLPSAVHPPLEEEILKPYNSRQFDLSSNPEKGG